MALSGVVVAGVAGCSGTDAGETGEESTSASDALRVCETGASVHGVDVSIYQGSVHWRSVRAAGKRFGIARVGDGLHFGDSTFGPNWHGMRSAGLVRGAYQFFRPGQDPVRQAKLLLGRLHAAGGLHAGDLAPVLDIETTDGVRYATIRARARKWLAYVHAHTGRKPIVYTANFMSPVIRTSLNDYPLWVANYGASCPSVPAGWSHWRMWQYSSTGHVSGIRGDVDVNKFHGTLAELRVFAGAASTAAEEVATPLDVWTPSPTDDIVDVAGGPVDERVHEVGAGILEHEVADDGVAAPTDDGTEDPESVITPEDLAAVTLPDDPPPSAELHVTVDGEGSGAVMGDGTRAASRSGIESR